MSPWPPLFKKKKKYVRIVKNIPQTITKIICSVRPTALTNNNIHGNIMEFQLYNVIHRKVPSDGRLYNNNNNI